ncbi:WD repeat-containing protein 83 [Homalodisca vitripennis]|nr:WD repeat-containing protein 83 [Homalodisca vitripennis]
MFVARVRVLQKWVKDLTDQNDLLVKTVEELETDALQRLTLLEANITDNQNPQLPCTDTRVEHLCNDIRNLLELLRRFREKGFWYLNNLKFKIVTYEDIFGCPPELCKYNNHSDKSPRSFSVPTEKVAGRLRKCSCSKL